MQTIVLLHKENKTFGWPQITYGYNALQFCQEPMTNEWLSKSLTFQLILIGINITVDFHKHLSLH